MKTDKHLISDSRRQYLDHLDAANKHYMTRVGLNNKALREYIGISAAVFTEQIKERFGFTTYRQTIGAMERNNLYNFSLNYLNTLAIYWNIPLTQLSTVDYSIESNIPEHIKLISRKENKFIAAFQRKRVA